MPATEARFQCRHILADGRRCRSACLRHEDFCYYHHASRKPVANPAGRKSRRGTFTLPRIEDRASILLAVNQILARIATNDVDARRAGRLLYALQIAACSMPRIAAAKPVDEEDSGLIEEVIQHPTLGEIAPRSELATPERDRPRKSLAQELREEMEALEARNIAEFGACADDANAVESAPVAPQSNDLQSKLREAREELESRQDRIHGMHKDLAKYREDLAKANAQLAEAKAETQHAEEAMVWHMDRHAEARTALETLKSEPGTLDRLHAVAEPGAACRVPRVTGAPPMPTVSSSEWVGYRAKLDRLPLPPHKSVGCRVPGAPSMPTVSSSEWVGYRAKLDRLPSHPTNPSGAGCRVPHPCRRSHRRNGWDIERSSIVSPPIPTNPVRVLRKARSA